METVTSIDTPQKLQHEWQKLPKNQHESTPQDTQDSTSDGSSSNKKQDKDDEQVEEYKQEVANQQVKDDEDNRQDKDCKPDVKHRCSLEAEVLQKLLNSLEDYESATNPEDECYAVDVFQQLCQSVPVTTSSLYRLFCTMAEILPAARLQLIKIRDLIATAKEKKRRADCTFPHPRGRYWDDLSTFLAYLSPNIPHQIKQDLVSFGHCWIYELSCRLLDQRNDTSIRRVRQTQHQPALTRRGLEPARIRLQDTMARAQLVIDKAPYVDSFH
jgi:hypothetical protein